MEYQKVAIQSLRSTCKILKAVKGDFYRFQSGSVASCNEDGIIISARSCLPLIDGCLPSGVVDGLCKLPKDYYSFKIIEENILKIRRGTFRTQLYIRRVDDFSSDIDLWRPDLDWHTCPRDLPQGICKVVGLAAKANSTEQEAFTGVHIVDDYIYAVDDNFCRAARYKLSAPSGLEVTIISKNIKSVLSSLRGRELIRVAEIAPAASVNAAGGIALDFGEIRLCVPYLQIGNADRIDGGSFSGFVKSGRYSIRSTVSSVFRTPCKFMINVTKELKIKVPHVKLRKGGDIYPLSIKFANGRITFRYHDERLIASDKMILKDLKVKYGISVDVDFTSFNAALKSSRLMGILNFRTNDDRIQQFLYFKDKRLERFLRAK